jgi:hypothetical protein
VAAYRGALVAHATRGVVHTPSHLLPRPEGTFERQPRAEHSACCVTGVPRHGGSGLECRRTPVSRSASAVRETGVVCSRRDRSASAVGETRVRLQTREGNKQLTSHSNASLTSHYSTDLEEGGGTGGDDDGEGGGRDGHGARVGRGRGGRGGGRGGRERRVGVGGGRRRGERLGLDGRDGGVGPGSKAWGRRLTRNERRSPQTPCPRAGCRQCT